MAVADLRLLQADPIQGKSLEGNRKWRLTRISTKGDDLLKTLKRFEAARSRLELSMPLFFQQVTRLRGFVWGANA